MASAVLSLMMVGVFRALTLFVQGTVQIQKKLPAQRAIQGAWHMLLIDLLSASRCSVNNLLPNPGFEENVPEPSRTLTRSTSTWSCLPDRMRYHPNVGGAAWAKITTHSSWVRGERSLMISAKNNPNPQVYCQTIPVPLGEPYLFTGRYAGGGGGSSRNRITLLPTSPAGPTIWTSVFTPSGFQQWTTSFTTTTGTVYEVQLNVFDSAAGKQYWGVFDNVYLGPMSVEVSTSQPSGKLSFIRFNVDGEREKMEYSMDVTNGQGRLVRTRFRASGVQEVSYLEGIDSLKVSWKNAPSPASGTDRPLLVELVGRGPNSRPEEVLTASFEVYPNVD